MEKEKGYNGWTNYETWRIMLEFFDGVGETYEDGEFEDKFQLADYLKDEIQTFVADNCSEMLIEGWANAFVSEANFDEIADRIAEDYPKIIKK